MTKTSIEASRISVLDSGSYFTGTDVEASLQEVGAKFNHVFMPMASYVNLSPLTVTNSYPYYANTLSTLQTIEDTVSPTNAQVVAAVKFLAKTVRLILKLLARMVT